MQLACLNSAHPSVELTVTGIFSWHAIAAEMLKTTCFDDRIALTLTPVECHLTVDLAHSIHFQNIPVTVRSVERRQEYVRLGPSLCFAVACDY